MPQLTRSGTVFMDSPHLEVGYLHNICSERRQVDWPLAARKSNYLFLCRCGMLVGHLFSSDNKAGWRLGLDITVVCSC